MFTKDTIVEIECGYCHITEKVKLGDLPTSSQGFFILPFSFQCIKCLSVAEAIIREGEEE